MARVEYTQKNGSSRDTPGDAPRRAMFYLVLWARLELARLAPLPPQDSVSTNSTTRAMFAAQILRPSLLAATVLCRLYLECRKFTVIARWVQFRHFRRGQVITE